MKRFVNIFGFAIALVLLTYCSNQKNQSNDELEKKVDSTSLQTDHSSTKDETVYQTPRDYNLFWKEFRQAVLDSDSIRLQQMTVFPLKVHGYSDEHPQIDIYRKDFYKFFGIMLNESHVEHDSLEDNRIVTCLDEIKRSKTFLKNGGKADPQYPYDFCNMVFRCNDLGWKLELIYLDTRELDKELKR